MAGRLTPFGVGGVPKTLGMPTVRTFTTAKPEHDEYNRNLFTFTEQFDNAVWTKARGSCTANAINGPDGFTTGDQYVEDGTTGNHGINKNISALLKNGSQHTLSCHLKAGARTWAYLEISGAGSAYFNLSNGTLGTTGFSGFVTAAITDAGAGWWRCSVSAITPGSTFAFLFASTGDTVNSYAGDSASGIYYWGAQLEHGGLSTYKPNPIPPDYLLGMACL